MQKAPPQLIELVRGAVVGLGYEFVGVEYLSRPQTGHLLRVYIDAAGGVGLGDCEKASHQISGVLEVDDPIRGAYSLEVSSPGLDRPLFEKAHFQRFVGEVARVKLVTPVDGRSNYKGTILDADGDELVMQVEEAEVRLPFARIASARLVPQF